MRDSDNPANADSSEGPIAARALASAQKSAREYAHRTKEFYNRTLSETDGVLEGGNLGDLRATINNNNSKFRQLSHGNNKNALGQMEAAENQHLGSLTDDQKGSLKQLQETRRNYMNAAAASTQTAARHDAVAGNVPFELADKKKSLLSERSQGIIKNYVDSKPESILGKVGLAYRGSKSKNEAAASQEFLENMKANRSITVEQTSQAAQGSSAVANEIRSTDPATATQLDELAKVLDGTVRADTADEQNQAGGRPASAEEEQKEQNQVQKLDDDLKKGDNKEIVYHTQSGQHRISFDKASGTYSSKNPEALAKFMAAKGDPDFHITHGSPESASDLLHHLVKEGVQDVTMEASIRTKIQSLGEGGKDLIKIADARSETFRNTSVVEQSERSLNALTFTRMTNPEDASARTALNREYCTHEDRQDMMGILKEKLDDGQITQEQFAQQAKEVLKPSTLQERESLTSNLDSTLKASIETASLAPAPAPALTSAATTQAQLAATPSPAPLPQDQPSSDTLLSSAQATPTSVSNRPLSDEPLEVPSKPLPQPELPRPSRPLPETPTDTVQTGQQRTQTAEANVSSASSPAPSSTTPTSAAPQPSALSQTSGPSAAQQPQPSALSQTSGPSAAPTTPAPRPTWTQMGMKEARDQLKETPSTENKSSGLAGIINDKLNSLQSRGQNKLDTMKQYLEGIKNFLKSDENNTQTKFTDTVAALATLNPATVPAALPTLSPPELREVTKKISDDKKTDKAEEALQQVDDHFDDWKNNHPKKSSGKESKKEEKEEKKEKDKDKDKTGHKTDTNQQNADPNQKDKTEVDKTKKTLDEAKTKVAEAKKSPQEQQTAQGQSPSPGGGGDHK